MIVVAGVVSDDPVRFVLSRLVERGDSFVFLDQRDFPAGTGLRQDWHSGEVSSGYLRDTDGTIADFDEVTGVYVRYVEVNATGQLDSFATWERDAIASERSMAKSAVFDGLSCVVVNRLKSEMSNACKPYQLSLASRYGFLAPRTLITTDIEALRAFYADCNEQIIYKAMGGTRSIVRKVDQTRIDQLSTCYRCPVLFQEFVAGVNVRVHVVGKRVFATRIHSSEVDYRYAADRFEPVTLPASIESNCVRMTRDLGLAMSGIDLIETDDGYHFLEANTSPGFSFFETGARQPISNALVDLLAFGYQREFGS